MIDELNFLTSWKCEIERILEGIEDRIKKLKDFERNNKNGKT